MNHAANRRRVGELNRVVDAAQSHALDDRGLLAIEPDRALDEPYLYLSRGPNTRSPALACGGPFAPRRSRRNVSALGRFLRCFFRHMPSFVSSFVAGAPRPAP